LQSIAVEAGMAAHFPVVGVIFRNLHAGTQSAEELVSVRVYHNSYVAPPHNDVSGERYTNPAKGVHSIVKVSRSGIVVREPGPFIDVMDKMRAIQSGPA